MQPQRPTFANDTATTPEDVLEVEFGVSADPRSPGRDIDLPLGLKLGLGPRTELFGGLGVLRSVDGEDGIGDVTIGLRHRLWDETYETVGTAFQLSTKLPAASESRGLGSGEIDFFAAGIHTRTIDRTAFTLFYQAGLVSEPAGVGQDLELALAGMVRTDLTRRMLGFGEVAGVFQPENDLESIFLTVGGAFRYAPWMYLDLGLSVGLTHDAPDVLLLVGLTRNLGRVLGRGTAGTEGP